MIYWRRGKGGGVRNREGKEEERYVRGEKGEVAERGEKVYGRREEGYQKGTNETEVQSLYKKRTNNNNSKQGNWLTLLFINLSSLTSSQTVISVLCQKFTVTCIMER